MKAGEIVDAAITESNSPLIIEMPNGQQITTSGYSYGTDKRGDPVLIIKAGKLK
jgi:hypothetical protein